MLLTIYVSYYEVHNVTVNVHSVRLYGACGSVKTHVAEHTSGMAHVVVNLHCLLRVV